MKDFFFVSSCDKLDLNTRLFAKLESYFFFRPAATPMVEFGTCLLTTIIPVCPVLTMNHL